MIVMGAALIVRLKFWS